jgi:transketolase
MDQDVQTSGRLNWSASQLEVMAKSIRCDILTMIANAGSGHTGGSLSYTDCLTALIFNELSLDPENLDWDERDFWNVSNAHVSPLTYSVMAERGYFPKKDLLGFRQMKGNLQGHPSAQDVRGIEFSAGSLGQGLGVAIGVALAAKMDKKSRRCYCLMGDGEQQEGSVWESAMCAAHYKLDNLVAFIDLNDLQIDGATADVMNIEPLSDKYLAFGWHVIEIDGHDIQAILDALKEARTIKEKPTIILAKTIMGKGWNEIENDHKWHGRPPTIEEANRALIELGTSYDKWYDRLLNGEVNS